MLIESAPGALTFDRAVADAALPGLLAARKTLPAKLFYDDEGCRLFGEITRLPEYYPTRTELALLREVAPEAVAGVPPGSALVEYGASDEGKAVLLLDATPSFAAYVPIDVAAGALAALAARLQPLAPQARRASGRGRLPRAVRAAARRCRHAAHRVLSRLDHRQPRTRRGAPLPRAARQTLGAGAHFLVGVDLRKDPSHSRCRPTTTPRA